MALKSMTGFGAAGQENEDYKVHVEVKSVNQRYLDISFSMPRALNVFENDMRNVIKKYSARGKVDVNIVFHDKREKEATIVVDKKLAHAYQTALYELGDFLHLTPPADVCKIALYPDVLRVHEESRDVLDSREILFASLESALEHFSAMRKKEGEHTRRDFEPRLDFLAESVEKLSGFEPEIVERYRAHLTSVLGEMLKGQGVDEMRIMQETVLYADRISYNEEVVRLKSHIAQFRETIEEEATPIGRKLDFLIQEINRETNTIGAKANFTQAAKIVVEIKSEVEKLREQVQNIE
ncbi:YicC/YloC family endoribonuclease [Selenomonas sp.]|uniref:YicC/YloC family endoribonuclease n=1 Tax=Selenomonas sp. TaxID=2053611 RepID=UPI003FA30EA3